MVKPGVVPHGGCIDHIDGLLDFSMVVVMVVVVMVVAAPLVMMPMPMLFVTMLVAALVVATGCSLLN